MENSLGSPWEKAIKWKWAVVKSEAPLPDRLWLSKVDNRESLYYNIKACIVKCLTIKIKWISRRANWYAKQPIKLLRISIFNKHFNLQLISSSVLDESSEAPLIQSTPDRLQKTRISRATKRCHKRAQLHEKKNYCEIMLLCLRDFCYSFRHLRLHFM